MDIECISVFGKKVQVPQEKITYRVSAYGIIIYDFKILLLRMKDTGKYCLPGGGVDPHETISQGLQREVKEECGIEILQPQLLGSRERFFYYDPWDIAWHNLCFFYSGVPSKVEKDIQHEVIDEGAEQPQWVNISSLGPEDFQVFGEEILHFYKERVFTQF